jgi:sodium-dependent dicarboxylate transporter 2/3/5
VNRSSSDGKAGFTVGSIGLWLGPSVAIALQFLPIPSGLDAHSWIVVSLVVLMATWWVTEAIPIPVTAMLPLVILPISGVMPIAVAARPYSSPIVMMLLGGFIIATSVERWQLHKRIALNIVSRGGTSPAGIVGGFMVAGAVLSMWISNSATTIMLAPIAVSVAYAILGPAARGAPLTISILLGLAYGASIGGIATPVGTPTNLIVIGYLEEQVGVSIGFAQWMSIGLPVVAVMLPACWLTVTRFGINLGSIEAAHGQDTIRRELAELGSISIPERRVLITFSVIAIAWILRQPLGMLEFDGLRPFSGLTDHVIAIAGAIALFLIPAGNDREPASRLLDWETAVQIPWGVILLFGGGLSMASAITNTRLAGWLGESLVPLTSLPALALIVALVVFVIFATEIMSNIATASTLLPVIGALALASDANPVLLSLPIAMAASCAFMLPIATGPNAIAFSTGEISIPQMVKVGLILNLLGIGLISVVIYLLAPYVL